MHSAGSRSNVNGLRSSAYVTTNHNEILKNHQSSDALPKSFINSMKTLFDILDDQQTGFVKFIDIEKRWQDDGVKGPTGVVDSLRKVTPASGLLSFERFCAGLKICLLRSKTSETHKQNRPPSAPILDMGSLVPNTKWNNSSTSTATVRPNNIQSQRTLSMPQLGDSDSEIYCSPPPPPKPPRCTLLTQDKSNVLDNWPITRGAADGELSYQQKKPILKRREVRRHTLQNGIDQNMLKKLRQYEQEKEVLLQGLSAVEKARDWYVQKVAKCEDKIKYLGQIGSHIEQWTEAHQEKLDFQRTRVQEVNRHLEILADTWERGGGFPYHMNLALRYRSPTTTALQQQSDQFKERNRFLTEQIQQKKLRDYLLQQRCPVVS